MFTPPLWGNVYTVCILTINVPVVYIDAGPNNFDVGKYTKSAIGRSVP
jgi:hypothetical protein